MLINRYEMNQRCEFHKTQVTIEKHESSGSISIDSLEETETETRIACDTGANTGSLGQSPKNELTAGDLVNILRSRPEAPEEKGASNTIKPVLTQNARMLKPEAIPHQATIKEALTKMTYHSHIAQAIPHHSVRSTPISHDITTTQQIIQQGGKQTSRIPVRSRTFSIREESTERLVNVVTSAVTQKAKPHVEGNEVAPSSDGLPPTAPTRSRSHHAIGRPRKDFIQLNKSPDFRRAKTYHTLHLERQLTEKQSYQTEPAGTAGSNTEPSRKPLKFISRVNGQDLSNSEQHDAPILSITPSEDTHMARDQKPVSPISKVSPKELRHTPNAQKHDAHKRSSENGELSPRQQGKFSSRAHRPVSQLHPDSPRLVREGATTPIAKSASEERRRSRIPVAVDRSDGRQHRSTSAAPAGHVRELHEEYRLSFHESRLSYNSSAGSQSEWELALRETRLTSSRHSLISVQDNKDFVPDGSAPSLLQTSVHQQQNCTNETAERSPRGKRLQSARTVRSPPLVACTPPERQTAPHRKVPFKPNLKPYPRDYISMGRLGPDPETIKQRQEKVRRQQEYADEVARKNRAAVKRIGYAQQTSDSQQTALQKMADYAKTVPRPRIKPKCASPERSSHDRSPEWQPSPMSQIQQLLTKDINETFPIIRHSNEETNQKPTSLPPSGHTRQPQAGHVEARPVRRPANSSPPAAPPKPARLAAPPMPAAPQPTGRPPLRSRRGGRPARRSSGGGGGGGGRARLTSSLDRLRTLTARLVSPDSAAALLEEPAARGSVSDDTGAGGGGQPHRDDSRTTVAASDVASDCSVDSLLDVGRRSPVVHMGHSKGAPRSAGGRGHAPARFCADTHWPSGLRCSRAVGPDGPLPGGPVAAPRHPSVEDVFYDTVEQPEEVLRWATVAPRRPSVTRGTQAHLIPLPACSDPMVVDIGLPVAGSAGPGRGRAAHRSISPDSLVSSPRQRHPPAVFTGTLSETFTVLTSPREHEPSACSAGRRPGLPPRPPAVSGGGGGGGGAGGTDMSESIQRLHERHLRDKLRVDQMLATSTPQF